MDLEHTTTKAAILLLSTNDAMAPSPCEPIRDDRDSLYIPSEKRRRTDPGLWNTPEIEG